METVTNWIMSAGSAALIVVMTISWLASIRAQNSMQAVSSRWFSLPVWMQIILGLVVIASFIYVGILLWISLPLNPPPLMVKTLSVIGLAIYLAGLFLAFWARWALGSMYGVSTSLSAQLQKQHRLVQRGPFALVRHPMYLGYWLLLLGVTLVYRTWTPLILLTMTLASFSRRAQREESALAERFGAEWQMYAESVPMFLPRWKKKSKETNQ